MKGIYTTRYEGFKVVVAVLKEREAFSGRTDYLISHINPDETEVKKWVTTGKRFKLMKSAA